MKTRAPVLKEEARTYYYEWKHFFDVALREHMRASLTPPGEGEKFEVICRVVQSAARTADQALAAIVEKNDEIGRALAEQEKWSAERKATP